MKEETLIALIEHVVNHFLIKFGTQSTCAQRLCLTASKDRTSVRHRQRRNLTPDGANLISLTAIETNTLIKDATTHSIALYIMIIAVHHGIFLFEFIFSKISMFRSILLLKICQNLLKGLGTSLLLKSLLSNIISGLIKLFVHTLTQLLIVHLVIVFALDVLAQFF